MSKLKYHLNQMFALTDESLVSIEGIKDDKYILLHTTKYTQGMMVMSEKELDEKIVSEYIWETK